MEVKNGIDVELFKLFLKRSWSKEFLTKSMNSLWDLLESIGKFIEKLLRESSSLILLVLEKKN